MTEQQEEEATQWKKSYRRGVSALSSFSKSLASDNREERRNETSRSETYIRMCH